MEDQATITKIEIQKRRKNRFSIFLDHEFAFGIDGVIVAQYGLKEGDGLTKEQIANLLFKEEKRRVKDQAYRYLAGRAHSEKELRTKLAQKGFENILVEEVISELKEARFIDDLEFAFAYARSRLVSRPVGEKLLRYELKQKGVVDEVIDKVTQKVYTEKSQLAIARELVEKRGPRYKNQELRKQKKRLADFLIRRGFEWEVVQEVIEEKFKS